MLAPVEEKTIVRGLRVLLALCALTLLLMVMDRFGGQDPLQVLWEDSFMFGRYAHNFMRYHNIVWNPGAPAIFALTSPAYFLSILLPIQYVFNPTPAVLAVAGSLACGILVLALLMRVVVKYSPAERWKKHACLLLVAFSLAMSSRDVSVHILSGMDTMFVVLFATVFLLMLKWQERRRSMATAILMGFAGGIAFAIRPDLLVITCGVPASYLVFAPNNTVRRQGATSVLISLTTAALQMWVAARYLNSPLPLSFYAKSLNLYPGFSSYKTAGVEYLLQFCSSYAFLFVALGAAAAWRRKELLAGWTAADKGMALAAVVFATYYTFGVTQVMGMSQRFYYPLLPILIYLATRALGTLLENPPDWTQVSRVTVALLFAFVLACLSPVFVATLHHAARTVRGDHFPFDTVAEYKHGWRMYWYNLDGFSRLPNDLVIATTETGHVAAMNLDKVVVDLSGLNETAFAHHPFSAARLFANYRPDLIYAPPDYYAGMNQELNANPVFRSGYEHFSSEQLGGAAMGISIRRDSKHYAEMRRLLPTHSQFSAEALR